MIQNLFNNIDTEIGILREISSYQEKAMISKGVDRSLLINTVNSLHRQLKILNDSIPELLGEISGISKLPKKGKDKEFERIEIAKGNKKISVVLPVKNKDAFLTELSISENSLERIKKKNLEFNEIDRPYKQTNGYVKLANSLFYKISNDTSKTQFGSDLRRDLRKANINMLVESYLSTFILTSILSIILGVFVGIAAYYFMSSFIWGIGSFLIVPFFTILSFLFFPKLEKDSLAKKIDQELPFAVIHMSAISGAGIEPSALFKIIALSKEYVTLKQEIRKVLNQINLYGYDLVTALTNASRNSPSEKLSELYTGLSTTITQGGSLSNFFEKRAETLLQSYRLEREKFTKVAETFMDIYITVVIAAPMILLLIFILLSVGDFNVGIGPSSLAFVIIGIVTVVNIIFMLILHIKQPAY